MMSSSSLSYLTLVVSIHLLGLSHPSLAANTAAWKSRSIYQTMTDRFARTDGSTTAKCNTTAGLYCGGTWRGTTNHLDYIQGMGFDAVMISPIVENVQGHVSYGESYHGYWPLDLYSLNSHFGTHQDLLDLSKALHDRDMYLMMDTVINNMAYITNGNNPATNIDYSAFTPFNNSDYFHEYCKIHDWNDWDEAQMCQTGDNKVALPDLYTEHEDVQHMLASWANEMIKTYSIDGLRIDAAKHVNNASLQNFQNNVDTFMTGEVLQREVETICNYQGNYINSVPNYPIYYSMLEAFTKGNTTDLFHRVEIMKQSCRDITAFVSFSENHDIQRIPSWMPEMAIAKNTLTFTMLFDGIPMIYQGQEQHFSGGGQPANREALWLSKYDTSAELYKLITKLNLLRKHAINLGHDYVNEQTSPIYVGPSELVFRKGVEGRHTIMVLSNQGSKGGAYTIELPVSYNAGTTVVDVLSCANYTVLDAGQLRVNLDKGEPRVLFPADMLEGSGLCGRPLHNITLTELKTGEKPSSGSRIVLTGSAVVVGVLSVAATLVLWR